MANQGRNEKGKFIKGSPPGPGRPLGSPNYVTQVVRERFQDIVDNNTDQIQGWLDEISKKNPARAMELFLRLTEFILPKKFESKIELHHRIEQVNININRNE